MASYLIVRPNTYAAACDALQIFSSELETYTEQLEADYPHHPDLEAIREQIDVLHAILDAFRSAIYTKEELNLMELPDQIKNKSSLH